jgi:hypothetical protein
VDAAGDCVGDGSGLDGWVLVDEERKERMIKLTEEQIEKLRSHLNSAYGFNACLEPLFAEYHKMINESKTHRVVEAPEGFEFATKDGAPVFVEGGGAYSYNSFKPIP